jgi:hypothetical protein
MSCSGKWQSLQLGGRNEEVSVGVVFEKCRRFVLGDFDKEKVVEVCVMADGEAAQSDEAS